MSQDVKKISLLLLVAFCLLPTVQTAVSVHLQWYTNFTYPLFKLLMIAGPIVVWLALGHTGRQLGHLLGLKKTNMLPGLAVGVLISAVILLSYYILLRPVVNPEPILAKVDSLGLTKCYWIMALFISLWHSLLEEYYWRGFLLSELHNWIPQTVTLSLIGGVIFGLHHIFIMMSVVPLTLVAVCVLGTMAAGFIWSWMRLAGYSIWDCYISHVFADLAVMWIGYDLILRAK